MTGWEFIHRKYRCVQLLPYCNERKLNKDVSKQLMRNVHKAETDSLEAEALSLWGVRVTLKQGAALHFSVDTRKISPKIYKRFFLKHMH